MNKLTVFCLDSVVRFSEESLLQLLEEILAENFHTKADLSPFEAEYNIGLKIQAWLDSKGLESLTTEQEESIRKAFYKGIKTLYIADEEAFEVRPGAQSIFNQLEKTKGWKFGIISPFWQKDTQFILQSCGVFSKTKLTISAEDGATEKEQIEILEERGQKKGLDPEIQVVCLRKAKRFKKLGYETLKPKNSKKDNNYYIYPKHSEFFGLKPKKNKDKNG